MPLNDAHFGGYFFAPEASKWTIYAFRGHNFSIRGLHPGPFFTFLKKVVYFSLVLWYNNHVSNNMTPQTKAQLEARKSLIASIAKRHAADRELFKSVEVEKNTDITSDYDALVQDEYARVRKSSTFNPISL